MRRAIEGIREAAVTPSAWLPALHVVAEATGAHSAQLIGFEPGRGALFNWWTAAEDGDLEWLERVGGNDPAVNSRVRKGLAAPEMVVLDETAFTTEMDRRLHPGYDDYVRRKRADNLCLTNLIIGPRAVVGFAIMRGAERGAFSRSEQRVFRLLADHARQAVKVMLRLRASGDAERLRTLDLIGAAAFICDRRGRVVGLTRAARELLRIDTNLSLAGDRLTLRHGDGLADLSALAQSALTTNGPPPLMLTRAEGLDPVMAIEALALEDADGEFGFGAAVLLQIRRSQIPASIASRLSRLFGLSGAEAEIARALLNGQSPEEIAQHRNVALGTVRAQVRGVYAKLNVSAQLQFAALVRAAL